MPQARSIYRDMAAVAGGLAVGIAGSRLLPPLAASASGSVRTRFGKDPFQRLIRDHRYIAATLEQMETAAPEDTAQRAKLFLILKRTLGKHAMAEEDVVYPLLHDEIHDEQQSKQLYSEHADIKIHLFELEKLLKAGEDWTDRVRTLRYLIVEHVREEEEVEFPKLREALQKKHGRMLSGQIHREEAMVL